MHTLLVALSTTALAEIGDKTQFLVLLLAARYRKPLPILLGVVLAALVSQAMAGALGSLLGSLLTPTLQRWLTGSALLIMAVWMLRPEHADDHQDLTPSTPSALLATFLAFFLAEMGDKTQISALVLAAHFHPLWQVILGGSIGLVAVNAPVIWLGARQAQHLPLHWIRRAAALLFALLGAWTLLH